MRYGGIFLPGKKENSYLEWTLKRPKTPKKIILPLVFGAEDRTEPVVQEGDSILIGQKIARPLNHEAVPIYSGVSGEVRTIARFPHPFLGEVPAMEIIASKNQSFFYSVGEARKEPSAFEDERLIELFREAGLIDVFPQPVSLAEKIGKGIKKRTQTLVINLCESEPYVASRFSLAMTHPLELLRGAEIVRSALRAEKVVIATEEDKIELAELLKSKIYFLKWKEFEVQLFPQRYPGDQEEILLEEIKGKSKCIIDPVTVFAAYEAVFLQKPFYERSITIGGECLIEPHTFWLPMGTLLEEAIRACKGFLREPAKIILNGPMRGTAVNSLELPVTCDTSALLALSKETCPGPKRGQPCLYCGKCLERCPAEIAPASMAMALEKNLTEMARDYGLDRCWECGICDYVCPAKRPITEWVRKAKKAFRK